MQLDVTGVVEDGSPRSSAVPLNPRRTLNVTLGASISLNVKVVTAAGQTVTGGTLVFTVKKRPADTQLLIQKSAACAAVTTFSIAPADTKKLAPGQYTYDIWLTDPLGNRSPVVPISPMLIEPAVTLPP